MNRKNQQRLGRHGLGMLVVIVLGILATACGGNGPTNSAVPFDADCHSRWVIGGTGEPYTNIKVYPSDLVDEKGKDALEGRMQAFFMPDRTGSAENRRYNVSSAALDTFVESVRRVMNASKTDRLPMINALAYSESGRSHTGPHSDDRLCAVNADKFPISGIYDFSGY